MPTSHTRHRALGWIWAWLVVCVTLHAPVSAASQQRDVVLIVTDDQAWHTMRFMPRTKAVIADAGVRFSNAFASTPLCCPSRASILTGLYSHNHNVLNNLAPYGGATRFEDASTLATWLRRADYRTGFVGRYLHEYETLEPWPYIPPGWAYWVAYKVVAYYGQQLVENGRLVSYGGDSTDYSTSVLGQKVVNFIESASPSRPIFVMFAPFAPHSPALPKSDQAGSASTVAPWRPPSYNEGDTADKPAWIRAKPPLDVAARDSTDALYRRQIETLKTVDEWVGKIVAALERSGRLENAVVIYTSDNGLSLGEHRWLTKNCVYEPCVRVPLLVRMPGVLPRTDTNLVSNVDLAPTIAELAGVTPPAATNGRSLVPLLLDPRAAWRDALLLEVLGFSKTSLEHRANFQAVRTPRYVYAEYMNGDRELYDLLEDPDQLTNVVTDPRYASIIPELQDKLEALRRE